MYVDPYELYPNPTDNYVAAAGRHRVYETKTDYTPMHQSGTISDFLAAVEQSEDCLNLLDLPLMSGSAPALIT